MSKIRVFSAYATIDDGTRGGIGPGNHYGAALDPPTVAKGAVMPNFAMDGVEELRKSRLGLALEWADAKTLVPEQVEQCKLILRAELAAEEKALAHKEMEVVVTRQSIDLLKKKLKAVERRYKKEKR